MIDGGEQRSEEEARRVWQRAADLQAAAADHGSSHRRAGASVSAPLGAARRAGLGTGALLTAGGGLVGGWAAGALLAGLGGGGR